jgi:hypothetical protein
VDHEKDLAAAHESEFTAGKRFDRGWVFPEAPNLLAQPGVFDPKRSNRRREGGPLPARAQRLDQAAFARRRIERENGGNERQPEADAPAIPRNRRG